MRLVLADVSRRFFQRAKMISGLAAVAAGFGLSPLCELPLQAQTLQVDPLFAPELRLKGGSIYTTAVQADGKIIVGGSFVWINDARHAYLARFNADGSLDSSFDPQIEGGYVHSVVIQPDGNIIAGGAFTKVAGNLRSGLVRLTSAGAIDPSFASNAGVVGEVRTVARASDSSIIVGGIFSQTPAGNARASVARFSSTGVLDGGFQPSITGYDSGNVVIVNALLPLPDGRLVVGGYFGAINGVATAGMAVLTSGGAVDAAWSTRTWGMEVSAVARDSNGRLYAAVASQPYQYTSTWPRGQAIVRLDSSLAPDTSWQGGAFTGTVKALLPLVDGRVLVAGVAAISSSSSRMIGPLVRLQSDGTLDASYQPGTVGLSVYALGSSGASIVAAGSWNGAADTSAITILTSVGDAGPAIGPRVQGAGYATAAAVQPDGKIVVAGQFDAVGSVPADGLVRLTPAGRVDRSFAPPAGTGRSAPIFVMNDGRMLVQAGGNAVIRLKSDGARDGSYSVPTTTTEWAMQPDGKLVLLNYDSLRRYRLDGIVDASKSLSSSSDQHLAMQADGTFIVAGTFTTAGPNYRSQPNLARYNTDLSFDDSFASPFRVPTQYQSQSPVSLLSSAPNGGLFLYGTLPFADGTDARLARLTAAGVRDATFSPALATDDSIASMTPLPDGGLGVIGNFNGTRVRVFKNDGTVDTGADFAMDGSVPSTRALVPDGAGGLLVLGWYRVLGGMPRSGFSRLSPNTTFATLVDSTVTGTVGSTVTVTPRLAGSGAATYQWYRNGAAVAGASSSTLTLSSFDPATQSGNYTLRVTSGSLAFDTDPVAIAANAAPVITSGPASVVEDIGGTAVFQVSASGSPAPTYQWRKNGTMISGATSSTFTLVNLHASDAGTYSVDVANSAGTAASPAATLTLRTTTLDPQFKPGLVQDVPSALYAMAALPDGRAVASGNFGAVNGQASTSFVMLKADGTLEPAFAPTTSTGAPILMLSDGGVVTRGDYRQSGSYGVYPYRRFDANGQLIFEIEVSQTSVRVFSAGSAIIFATQYNYDTLTVAGLPAPNGVARVRLDGTLDLGFSIAAGANGVHPTVLGAMGDGRLYVQYVETSNSTSARRIVRTLTSGAIDSTFAQPTMADTTSDALVQADGRLVIRVSRSVANSGGSGLVRFNLDGSIDTAFRDAQPILANSDTSQLIASFPDGRLLVRQGSGDWWRLQASGQRDGAYVVPSAGSLQVVAALTDGSVLAWTSNYYANPSSVTAVSRFDPAGHLMSTGVPRFGVGGAVAQIAQRPGGRIYLTGSFHWVNGLPRCGIARLEHSGQTDTSFVSDLSAGESVTAVAVQADGRLMIAGTLARFNGDTVATRILRLQEDGTRDGQYCVDTNGTIRDLAMASDGSIVLGGEFTMVDGVARSKVARLLPTGALDLGFVPPFSSVAVSAVASSSGGRVLAAYGTDSYNTSTLQRLTAAGDFDPAWPPVTLNSIVTDIQMAADGSALLTGSFTMVNSAACWGIVRLTPSGDFDATFRPSASSAYNTPISAALIEPDSGKIVVGGGFVALNVMSRAALGRLRSDGGLDPSFAPQLTSTVNLPRVGLLSGAANGDIIAAGGFAKVDGIALPNLARWTTQAFAITFPSAVQTLSSGSSTTLAMTVQGTGPFTYQWRKDGADIGGATNATLGLTNVDASAAGRYTLRVSNGSEAHESDAIVVTVAQAPVIAQQPQSVVVDIGTAAQFSIGANASPSPTYEWRKDGLVLPGETRPILLIPTAAPSDVGTYSVVVTNGLGAVTSASATLSLTGARIDQGFNPALLRTIAPSSSALTINAAIMLGDGRFLVGGSFVGVAGVASPYVARLLADGSVDRSYIPPGLLTNPVSTLTRLGDGTIMIGTGNGTGDSGSESVLAIHLSTDGTFDPSFAALRGYGIASCFAQRADGSVYVGGDFRIGTSRSLVRVTATGIQDPGFSAGLGTSSIVNALAMLGDTLVVAKSQRYSYYNSTATWNPLTRYSADGQQDTSWLPTFVTASNYSVTTPVVALAATSAGQLVVAGPFLSIDGTASGGIARFNTDGTVDAAFAPTLRIASNDSSGISLFPLSGGRVVVSGFTITRPDLAAGVARLANDGTLEQGYTLGTTDRIVLYDVAADGGILARSATIGSYYSSTAGNHWPMLLRLASTGAVTDNFDVTMQAAGQVVGLATMPDGRIIVAGEFTNAGGSACLRVARLLPGGGLDRTFASMTVTGDGSVPTIKAVVVQSDGRVIIGGQFSTFNGVNRPNLVRLNANGSIDGAYNPAANGGINALALDSTGRLLVGGIFTSIGGGAAKCLARLDSAGALDSTFQPAGTSKWGGVTAVAIAANGQILVSGYSSDFYSSGGLVRLQPDGTQDTSFAADGSVIYSIGFLPDGRLAVVTGGSSFGADVAILSSAGVRDPSFDPTFDIANGSYSPTVAGLIVQPDGKLVVAGNFIRVNGMPRAGLVRLFTDGSVDSSLYPGAGAPAVAALGRQPGGALLVGGAFAKFGDVPSPGLVRFVDRRFFVGVPQSQVIAPSGSTATLAVVASGEGPFTYVWKRAGTVQPGATLPTLSVANVSTANAGDYVCEVTSGGDTIASDPITLVVGTAPTFTTQPSSLTVGSGNTATLTVVVAGDAPIALQWYRYTEAISGATSSTLVRSGSSDATGEYYVVATNAYGFVASKVAAVLMGTAPTSGTISSNAPLTVGNTLTLSAYPGGTPVPEIQWRKDGVAIPGLVGTSVSIPNVTTSNAGSYSFVATNAFGSSISSSASVVVNPSTPAAPVITTQPASQTVSGSSYVYLSVIATGNPAPTYQWRLNGAPISGATSANYSIWSQLSAAGDYDVVVSNSQGTITSDKATVTVQQAPTFIQYPQSVQVSAGARVTLTVTVAAYPVATLQWRKDGSDIPNATGATLVLSDVTGSDAGQYSVVATNSLGSATSSSATLTVTSTAQRGLTSGTGRVNAGAPGLTATFTIEGTTAKKVLVRALGPALTKLGVSGVMPDPVLTVTDAGGGYVAHNNNWADAANASDISLAVTQLGALSVGADGKDAALLLLLAPGTYTATVTAADGTAGVALFEVYEADTVLRLVQLSLRAPAGGGDAILTYGFNVVGSVARPYLIRALGPKLGVATALADPRLSIWRAGTQVAANDDWNSDATEGARLSAAAQRLGAAALDSTSKDAALLLTLSPGSYVAQVTGSSNQTGDVVLEIIEADSLRAPVQAPAFELMPQSQDSPAGSTVTLSALATGVPAPTYQWIKDGAPVAGGTGAVLALSNLQVAQAGVYSVTATNSAGTAVSLPATIGIGSGIPPAGTHSVVGGGFLPGGIVTITNTLAYSDTATSLAWSVTLPAGWSYAAGGSNEGDVRPTDGSTGTLGWSWTTPPRSPVTFTYHLNVPAGENAIRAVTAAMTVRTTTIPVRTVPAGPNSLVLVPAALLHAADTNGDGKISLLELTRVIELYNTRNGTVRTGCYAVATTTTEDGFAPDTTRSSSSTAALTGYHSADSNHDGKISLLELTRVIELYNNRNGTVRTGQYHVQSGTEDGFGPGP